MSTSISRRAFVETAALTGAAVAAATGAVASPALAQDVAAGQTVTTLPSFFTVPEPIADDQITETYEYDVVVIGAGTSGVPAAMSARKNGASVAVLQKVGAAVSQGGSAAFFVLEKSDEAGIQEVLSELVKENQYRTNRKLLDVWAHRSQEACMYVFDRSQEFEGEETWWNVLDYNRASTEEHPAWVQQIRYGKAQPGNALGVPLLAELAAKDGVEFYYDTPAVQLVKEDGRVVAVIAHDENEDCYLRFNATKGVILATGDYQNDDEMMRYYCPDCADYEKKQLGKTGDGHKMGLWAGAQMEPTPHTKMIHDFGAGPMFNEPLMCVNQQGTRFCDETVDMSYKCNFLNGGEAVGVYNQIFDANYEEQVNGWGGKATTVEDLGAYLVEEVEGNETEGSVRTYRADSIEELAGKLGIDPEALQTTVDEYNAMCEAGADEQFGKAAKYLQPVTTPPFYGIQRHLQVSAMCSGLLIDEEARVLDADGQPIPGLWAAGNVTGGFYGGVDYPLFVNGLSVGRCFTFGYIAGENAAKA